MPTVELRRLRHEPAELELVDRLLIDAYGFASRRSDLDAYLAAQPDGWFVLADGAEIVAVGGAFTYGVFAWIGLIATEPARQRQGLATRLSAYLVDWARGRGCRSIALDASSAGRPIYERLGFRVVGETADLSVPAAAPEQAGGPCRRVEDVEELLSLDRHVFGGDRAALLTALQRDADGRSYVADGPDGPAGYLFARARRLGPGCARTGEVARRLVLTALADTADPSGGRRLLLPAESRYLDVLRACGLRLERRLPHMRLGEPVLPGERDRLLAQTSFAAG
ncbi:MAG TPA: GNAT family N-acetyltransferase [Gaiellales bacterium]|nr:GNAT family N-acetyltransferase [Gaiellales bacterium]